MENKSRAEDRRNLRWNVIKGAVGIAAITGAVAAGYHFLKNRSLDKKLARDAALLSIQNKQAIDVIRENAKATVKTTIAGNLDLSKESNRHKEEMATKKAEKFKAKMDAITAITSDNSSPNSLTVKNQPTGVMFNMFGRKNKISIKNTDNYKKTALKMLGKIRS